MDTNFQLSASETDPNFIEQETPPETVNSLDEQTIARNKPLPILKLTIENEIMPVLTDTGSTTSSLDLNCLRHIPRIRNLEPTNTGSRVPFPLDITQSICTKPPLEIPPAEYRMFWNQMNYSRRKSKP